MKRTEHQDRNIYVCDDERTFGTTDHVAQEHAPDPVAEQTFEDIVTPSLTKKLRGFFGSALGRKTALANTSTIDGADDDYADDHMIPLVDKMPSDEDRMTKVTSALGRITDDLNTTPEERSAPLFLSVFKGG